MTSIARDDDAAALARAVDDRGDDDDDGDDPRDDDAARDAARGVGVATRCRARWTIRRRPRARATEDARDARGRARR
tara:strand:- start:689 stop:919 length:231 start_codon:yes stop_codon:yes gene_type:complete